LNFCTFLWALASSIFFKSSHQPIRGTVGQAVILPCHVEPPSDVTDRTVDWKLGAKFVYVYRHNGHDPDHQHADFKNRTYVDKDEMRKGNLSLRIFPLKKTDAGNYTCSVPRQDGPVMRVNTELIVGKCRKYENICFCIRWILFWRSTVQHKL
uniref:Ig-like domain-containing protein n=1 Tax=Seriola lalandi dorsalis TaxID=1841481 RepID=A0A3B4YF70_SERLL